MFTTTRAYVSAGQIKAARALLDWSQEDLAEACSLSVATIRKIESGHISPRDKTMAAIVTALDSAKIEFLASGLQLRNNEIIVFEGDDCYLQLLQDIYATLKDRKGSEVLFFHADNRLVNDEEREALIKTRKHGIKWRFLIDENNTYMHYPLNEYRLLPKKYSKRIIQLIYGTKIALGFKIDKTRDKTIRIVVIDSAPLVESNRILFEFIWDNCRKPTHSSAPKIFD